MDTKQFSKKPTPLRKVIRSATKIPEIPKKPSKNSKIPGTLISEKPERRLSIQTSEILDSPSTAPTPRDEDKSKVVDSSKLIESMKLTIKELQEETKKYKQSFEASNQSKLRAHKSKEILTIPDTIESEHRVSFLSKTKSSELNLNNLRKNIETLQMKIQESESKVLKTSRENDKLKEIVQKIENKLENRRMFLENPNISPCTINCEII
jgi:hypothetical protein